jgi:hypothetical protein
MELSSKDIERFWKNVEKTDTCWLYKTNSKRKAHLFFTQSNGKRNEYYATRVSKYINGDDIEGMYVYRTCVTPSCINPIHLDAGSKFDLAENLKRLGIKVGRKPKVPEPKNPNPLLVRFD